MDQATLKEHLLYDDQTGCFYRIKRSRGHRLFDEAGYLAADGYVSIGVAGGIYRAHRLAWLYTYGVWPEGQIDHKNGIKTDNRLRNLRNVSHAWNQHNRKTINKNNTTGFPGVKKVKNYFAARITVNGKSQHLGYFATAVLAHEAYLAAKSKHHGGYLP